jgi:hypothetical protein
VGFVLASHSNRDSQNCGIIRLSLEGEASIDSGLIHDQEVCIEEPHSGGFSFGRINGLLPKLAPNGHADPIERCPLLGPQRKTSAPSEYFAF